MQKSISASIAGNKKYPTIDLSNKLNKLTEKNDVLRKELIHISALVSSQLKNKKFVPKVKEREIVFDKDDEDPLMMAAIRRELENGYKEIDRVKKVIENSKKLEGNNSKN